MVIIIMNIAYQIFSTNYRLNLTDPPPISPWVYLWFPVPGFALMGYSFYQFFKRYRTPLEAMVCGSLKKRYLMPLFVMLLPVAIMGIIYLAILISIEFMGVEPVRYWIDIWDPLILMFHVMRLITYISILFIGISFHRLVAGRFARENIVPLFRLNNRFWFNNARIIGILGCICQLIYLIIAYLLGELEIMYASYPHIELRGNLYWINVLDLPFWLGTFFILMSMILFLLASINTIPMELLAIRIGKLYRTDLISLFKFALIILVMFSILRFISGMIRLFFIWNRFGVGIIGSDVYRYTRLFRGGIPIIEFLKFISPLFMYFGFLILCIGFHHIFRTWELTRFAEAGKPT
jgi:hypothetical protein